MEGRDRMTLTSAMGSHGLPKLPGHLFRFLLYWPPIPASAVNTSVTPVYFLREIKMCAGIFGEVQSVHFWGYLHPIWNLFPALVGGQWRNRAQVSAHRNSSKAFPPCADVKEPLQTDPIIRIRVQMIFFSPVTLRRALEKFVALKSA